MRTWMIRSPQRVVTRMIGSSCAPRRSTWESEGARCIGEHQVCTVEPNEFSQLLDQGILRGLKNSGGAKIGVIASGKLEKGGRGSNSETFHATLRVNESRPAELGQQPEASLAWGRATVTAKRR
jgi:hypothetical protein